MKSILDYNNELIEYHQALINLKPPEELRYKLKEIHSNFEHLFNRFCPYQIGDYVELTQTPEIKVGSGWYGSRHFLIEGAVAQVQDRDFRNGLFIFGLKFLRDSYIYQGEVIPIKEDQRGVYYFNEKYLALSERKP